MIRLVLALVLAAAPLLAGVIGTHRFGPVGHDGPVLVYNGAAFTFVIAAVLMTRGVTAPQIFVLNAVTYLFVIVALVVITVPVLAKATDAQGWANVLHGVRIARRRTIVGRLLVGMALWVLSLPVGAPPSPTHGWVIRLSLAVSDRAQPYSRHAMHRDHRRELKRQRAAQPAPAPTPAPPPPQQAPAPEPTPEPAAANTTQEPANEPVWTTAAQKRLAAEKLYKSGHLQREPDFQVAAESAFARSIAWATGKQP
jgi:hypothetical protein